MFTRRQHVQGAFYEFTGQASYGRLLAWIIDANSVVPPGRLARRNRTRRAGQLGISQVVLNCWGGP